MTRNRTPSIWPAVTVALAVMTAVALWVVFSVWTATSWLAFPHFLLTAFILFVVPGNFLVSLWGLPVTPIERVTLSTALGMITTSFLYAVVAWAGFPFLLWVWVLAGVPSLLRSGGSVLGDFRRGLRTADISHSLLILALIAGFVPLFFISYYYGNLALTAEGGLTFTRFKDLLLHSSIAGELTHTVPPQIPFLAGKQLSYHIGMDLVAAVLCRYGGLSIPDLLVRFCPTLFIALDMLSVFCLARRLLGSGGSGVAAAVLTVLGEDLSFVPGLLRASPGVWCAEFFRAPTVFSLYSVNPMVAAHSLLFLSLFCLHRSCEDRRRGWVAATALCAAALIQTKIFAFLHLVLALGVVVAVFLVVFRRLVFREHIVGIIAASLPLALYVALTNRGGGQVDWGWSSGIAGYVLPSFRKVGWEIPAAYSLAGLVVYLAATYGFRAMGARELIRGLRPVRERPFPLLLAVFVLLGPLVSLTMEVAPRAYSAAYNNAIWFMVQSKYVATLFAVGALAGLWRTTGRAGRTVMIALVAVVSLASTIQFVHAKSSWRLEPLPPPAVEAIRFLNREAEPGQVVMSGLEGSFLALTRLRLPYQDLFIKSFASREVIDARKRDSKMFWKAWDEGVIREDLLARYRAAWIVAKNLPEGEASRAQAQALRDHPLIRQVFTNRSFTVYRLREPA